MDKRLERILPAVQKPARYTGGEYGQIIKDPAQVDCRVALCFPDTYEIGMSNIGLRILYSTINSLDGVWCQRVFAPWRDMEQEMRKAGIGLYALESGDPIGDFDIIAFSIGYEMAYPTILNMLDLAGLPVRSADRGEDAPLIVAGGTACLNPEPMADFIDLFLLGEGEELDNEVVELYRKGKKLGWSRKEFLRNAAEIQGVYVPSLYTVTYAEDGTIASFVALDGAPERVTKRIIEDMDSVPFPAETIVPSTEIVHDRVVLELFRGCVRGCRFCQAGYVYRPVRRRSPDKLVELGKKALEYSGYEEITLSSLSTSDYRGLDQLCDGLLEWCEPRSVSLSLPSLRADNFSMSLMERVQRVRRTGLTFAPEAGTQRLRDVINKNVTEEDLLESCRVAFAGGWSGLKLYFMLGLPTETDEDVLGIAELAGKVYRTWRENSPNKARGLRLTISTSCFIPKPHTPFQWEAQVAPEEYMRRVNLLRGAIRSKAITYNWHETDTSVIEAALAVGDRRMGRVIEADWRSGGGLDAWGEYFDYQRWLESFAEAGLDVKFYTQRVRGEDEILPWDMIDVGVDKQYLLGHRRDAHRACTTPDCRQACTGCGADCLLKGGVCDA